MLDLPVELEPRLFHHPQRGVVLGPGEADDPLEADLARRRSPGRRSPPRSRTRAPARRPGRSSPARPPARPRPWRRAKPTRATSSPRPRSRPQPPATAALAPLLKRRPRVPPARLLAAPRPAARGGYRASAIRHLRVGEEGRQKVEYCRPRRGARRRGGRFAGRPPAAQAGAGGLWGDGVPDPDAAAAQYLGAESGAVHRFPQHPGPGQALEVVAGLAQLDPFALDLADPKALAHQVVQPDSAGEDIAARFRRGQLDPLLGLQRLQRLGLDQREVVAGLLAGRSLPSATK